MSKNILFLFVGMLFFVACNKEDPMGDDPFVVEVIASYNGSVQAMIDTYQKLANGEYGLGKYEFTSITEENGGFKLNNHPQRRWIL